MSVILKTKIEYDSHIAHAALTMIKVGNLYYPADPKNSWINLRERQAVRDCLMCLKMESLIKDFCMAEGYEFVMMPNGDKLKYENGVKKIVIIK
jgi:hypothetical protein